MCMNGTKVHAEGNGRIVVELSYKWHLTSDDMLSVVASVNLPPGTSQTLRACSPGVACTYKHSEGGSALNRIRLIAKRKRLLLFSQRQPRATAATHTSATGIVREFDFGKGCDTHTHTHTHTHLVWFGIRVRMLLRVCAAVCVSCLRNPL